MRRVFVAMMMGLILGLPTAAAAAEEAIDDARALAGLDQGKGVFLVDIGNPQKLAFYLKVIKGTHQGMQRQGVEPEFILVYIGPSVKYLTSEPSDQVALEFEEELKQIDRRVEALDALGIRQEICAVATEAFDVDNDTVLPELDVVGDGFISIIGYQSKGYALVPVY